MSRRTLVGGALAVIVLAANYAVWRAGREPGAASGGDPRRALRRELSAEWESADSVPLDAAPAALSTAIGGATPGEGALGFGEQVSWWALPESQRLDLAEAVAGAVAAIAARSPEALREYMAGRGVELDAKALRDPRLPAPKAPSATAARRFDELWEAAGADPRWAAVVPQATRVTVWVPRSSRHVSPIQLGRRESWAWKNETLYRSLFDSAARFERAGVSGRVRLADVRVVVEHDGSLDRERSPYFFRFWRSEEGAKTWRPLALKVVRTPEEDSPVTPAIFF